MGLGRLFPARESLVSDIPTGDGNIAISVFIVQMETLKEGEFCVCGRIGLTTSIP